MDIGDILLIGLIAVVAVSVAQRTGIRTQVDSLVAGVVPAPAVVTTVAA